MATLKSIKNKYLTPSDGTVLGVTTNTENISALSFKLATADSLTKFNLVDGFADDYNDATGVEPTTLVRHTVTAAGTTTWTAPAEVTSVTALVVAGGGGGGKDAFVGGRASGGGGGGGVAYGTITVVPGNDYTITVGAGGAGGTGTTSTVVGTAGSNSVFGPVTALGGGGGGGHDTSTNYSGALLNGGSGGGAPNGGAPYPGGSSTQTDSGGAIGYGNDGGLGSTGSPYSGGGGGGANAVGVDAAGGSSGAGGAGKAFDISGSSVTYAGGGGGAGAGPDGAGGAGGGGAGAATGTAGTVNTGGGGGASVQNNGGAGGSGIVILTWNVGSINDIRNTTDNYYSGVSIAPAAIQAFKTTGSATYTASAGVVSIEVLVVGGGGGGGSVYHGAGGGGGGIVHDTDFTVVGGQAYGITVGAYGPRGDSSLGDNGGDTSFDNSAVNLKLIGLGGGGGSRENAPVADGRTGGSGGGGTYNTAGGASTQANFTGATSYGSAGGTGTNTNPGNTTGGGGGASAAGTGGTSTRSGDGGAGQLFSTFVAHGSTAANLVSQGTDGGYFGGGGGGSTANTPPNQPASGGGGLGGVGGGAAGAHENGIAAPPWSPAGAGGTGGGGGGGERGGSTGGNGDNGGVYIKENSLYDNIILRSNTFTAQTQPTTARIILDEETFTGTTTLNTDLKAYASRNNGTTFTQMTLADQGQLNYLAGIDSYTKLMLHCDGANGGNIFTDSSGSAHTVTAVNGAHTDTAVKKFGTASAQFDGAADYLTIPDSPDWAFGSGDFTIDFWVNNDNDTNAIMLEQGTNNDNTFQIWWNATSKMEIYLDNDGSGWQFNTASATTLAFDVWNHVALVRNGDNIRLYINGTLDSNFSSSSFAGSMNDGGDLLYIGRARTGTGDLTGYMDEIRISKGIARWTANFTPPATAYTHSRRLLSGSVDISGQPAGTNMKYKIETLNQAVGKQTRIYGTSMAWA